MKCPLGPGEVQGRLGNTGEAPPSGRVRLVHFMLFDCDMYKEGAVCDAQSETEVFNEKVLAKVMPSSQVHRREIDCGARVIPVPFVLHSSSTPFPASAREMHQSPR